MPGGYFLVGQCVQIQDDPSKVDDKDLRSRADSRPFGYVSFLIAKVASKIRDDSCPDETAQ